MFKLKFLTITEYGIKIIPPNSLTEQAGHLHMNKPSGKTYNSSSQLHSSVFSLVLTETIKVLISNICWLVWGLHESQPKTYLWGKFLKET